MHHHHHHFGHRGVRHGHRDEFFGGFGGRRGRHRRRFDAGELRLVLLKMLEDQPRHGYDLIREIESRTGGAYAPSPGLVYPMTVLLHEMGLIEEVGGEDGARKSFALTEAGRAHLSRHAANVEAAMARLQALAEQSERTDAASIVRAMQNLKVAIHNRLAAEGVDKTTVLDVARLIDQAATAIERV
jgi:DNA-binding PadR family transcriptional regulator